MERGTKDVKCETQELKNIGLLIHQCGGNLMSVAAKYQGLPPTSWSLWANFSQDVRARFAGGLEAGWLASPESGGVCRPQWTVK